MGSFFLALTGPRSSTGSPTTFMIRPSTSRPTGIWMGAPVFSTAIPRTRPVGGVHGDAADVALAQVLSHLDDQVARLVADRRVGDAKGGVDLGKAAGAELDVDDGPDDLNDSALAAGDYLSVRAHLRCPFPKLNP